MALFHLNVSSIGKSAGSSACAAAAYRSCSQIVQTIVDLETGLEVAFIHDFSNKKGLAFSEIFAPEGVASWCSNREQLWNKVEARETHVKGRYARDIKLALQTEFSLEQNIQLLSEYVKDTFVKDAIIADVNIHMDDPNNPHAHIMLTTRKLEMDDNGEWIFGNKNRLLDSIGWLRHIRNNWAEINNKYFIIHGIDKTITHESYEARGLEFIKTTIHEGAAKHTEDENSMLDRPAYNRNIVNDNLHYIKTNPGEVIQALVNNVSSLKGSFSRADLFKEIEVLLNEIATRGEEATTLVDEARASIITKCDEIFYSINQLDLGLDLGLELDQHVNGVAHNGEMQSFRIDHVNTPTAPINTLNNQAVLQENVRGLIARFFASAEKTLNIGDEFEFIRLNSTKLIDEISRNKAVFSKVDLAKVLDTHINEAILQRIGNNDANRELLRSAKVEILEKYDDLLVNLMSSSEIVKLVDADLSGKEVYTTKAQLDLEQEFISNVEKLSLSQKHALHLDELSIEAPSFRSKLVNRLNKGLTNLLTTEATSWLEKTLGAVFNHADHLTLSIEQRQAVLSLVNGPDMMCLSGMPGTGKSTVMAKLVQEYNNHGYEVVGAATSAVAALNLGTEAGIKSYTLSKWQHDWNLRAELEAKGEDVKKLLPNLTSKSIFIVDEMSMVDLSMYNYITSKITAFGAKIINLGDNNQFSAVGVGGASEKITEKAETIGLTELYRQRSDLDQEVTRKLGAYRVDEALVILDKAGRIKLGNSPALTRGELVNHYISQLHQENSNKNENNEARIVIAYRNEEVKALNIEIRTRLLHSGCLLTKNYEAEGREFIGQHGKMHIALNEQLVFTKNQRFLGVLNGQLGRVVEVLDDSRFRVQLLGKTNEKPKSVIINNAKFNHFDYGYAITSYKAQGKTYDHSYLLLDTSVGYEAFNVMATRHRFSSVFYIDRGVLNDIVSRKFDHLKEVAHQSNELAGNENAALFELLSKRNPNAFAHDYIDYDHKAEVIQIKAYLEFRDKVSNTYRQLLDWQSDAAHQGQKLELWDNEKLWVEFNGLREMRQYHAQELVEGYPQYQKYIDSSLINYATLLKHADAATIEFNYLDHTKALDYQNLNQEASTGYHELIALQKAYLNKPREQQAATAELILAKAEELMTLQQEFKCNLARLSNQIHQIENNKWTLESQKKASIHYREDLKHYLNQTYKDGAQVALDNWHELKQAMGVQKAIAHVEKDPESLGGLVGFGWSTKLSVSEKRAIAVFNLQSLGSRMNGYEKAVVQEHQLSAAITAKETLELTPLRARYSQVEAARLLSPIQEKYLDELQAHSEDLATWLKNADKEHAQEHSKATLSNPSIHKSELQLESNAKIISAKLTYADIHDKLAANINGLAQQLLPSITNKKIEINKHSIQCGSIKISLGGSKQGLWYRFSRNDEKGDLFDLIKVSQKLANKQAAIEWSKSYLGLEREQQFGNHGQSAIQAKSNSYANTNTNNVANANVTQEKLTKTSLKVLTPVPHNAAIFNPKMVFSAQLANKNGKNQVIEAVYAYKNIQNELCGYVVRIKDLNNNTKVTLPAVYTENHHGIKNWRAKGLGDDRCLYNEHRLFNSDKPVLIVEGEKTADTAQSLYPEFDVISWSGGANGFNKSNWNALKGKQVTIWPDNDKAGIDAAHSIQTLLENQNITKAKIIELDKIDYLPAKWDLADNAPVEVRQHQITGALFGAKGITADIRVDKTIIVYLEYSRNSLNEELNSKKLETLSEYIQEKEVINYKLYYEAILLKEKLQTKDVLSVRDEFAISTEASELVEKYLKATSLSAEAKPENISNHILHDLTQLHQNVPKAMLIEVTNAALMHTVQIMNEHNKLQQMNELHNQTDHDQNKKSCILSQADLPILALSMASNILSHHQNMNANLNPSIHNIQVHENHNNTATHNVEHQQQMHLLQSIELAKNSFKLRLDQDSMHFEQHQQSQQRMQRQVSQHQSMEM